MNQSKTIRLNKYLAQAGLGSRRSVEEKIQHGLVKVNGVIATSPAQQIDLENDDVLYDGNQISAKIVPTYIVLNKPPGYLCTQSDEKNRHTVHQLVRTPQRVFNVGRLDADSEGLLIMTNDGDFANGLIHPRSKIEKKYFVVLKQAAPPELEKKFQEGVFIERGIRVRGKLEFPNPRNRKQCVVTIMEGRNRQVRKMFAAFRMRVATLQRFQLGPLKLGSLPLGSWRYLTNKELTALKKAMGFDHGNHE